MVISKITFNIFSKSWTIFKFNTWSRIKNFPENLSRFFKSILSRDFNTEKTSDDSTKSELLYTHVARE